MRIALLADHREFFPTIAQWYIDEWGDYIGDTDLVKEVDKLKVYLNRNTLPLMLVAVEDDLIIGTAQLKFHEMEIYPEKEHWLGGVYVSKQHRGKGVAGRIVKACIEKADDLGVKVLYLQTEDLTGGFYTGLGWKPIEEVIYKGVKVLVMQRSISR